MSDEVMAFDDPNDPGNGPQYHTGRPCYEDGCERPAGTAWSPHWCFECNVDRIRRIDRNLRAMVGKAVDGSASLTTGEDQT